MSDTIDHDELNHRHLKTMVARRTSQVRDAIARLRRSLDDFERFPDPNAASNLVREASELARYTQGAQDLRDIAELPRGIEVVDDN